MQHLKFCPKCGNETLEFSDGKKFHCSVCDFVMFHNVAAAVAVLVQYKDEFFLTRRNQNPGIGKLDLAGGFTDPKETAEHTCYRELKEELNIEIEENKLNFLMSLPNIYHYKGIDYQTMDLFFSYEVEEKFEINLELSEISEGIWIKKQDLKIDEIAFDSQKRFFEKLLSS